MCGGKVTVDTMDLSGKLVKLNGLIGASREFKKRKQTINHVKGNKETKISGLTEGRSPINKTTKYISALVILQLVILQLLAAGEPSIQTAPSQLFLAQTPSSVGPLVSGTSQPELPQAEELATTGGLATETTAEEADEPAGSPTADTSPPLEAPDADQSVPIDANRQQFETHDQLTAQRAESRSGASRVAHVSSFLSDLFGYTTRPRQTIAELAPDQSKGGHLSHKTNPADKTLDGLTSKAPISSSAACPGVCRSILTAPILCRNEISASCPSFLQKCCDKVDEVSLNGTPVETSAPILGTHEAESTTQTPPQTSPTTQSSSVSQSSTQRVDLKATNEQTPTSGRVPIQPLATIYFISSSNDSLKAEGSRSAPAHGVDPVGNRLASQSFDRSSDEARSTPPIKQTDTTTTSTTAASLAPVLLQTVNGTLIHRPPGDGLKVRLRPNYANWTDYQLSMLQGKPLQASHSVVYHSNTDPVKRFGDRQPTTSTMAPLSSSSLATMSTSTTRQAAATVSVTPEDGCSGHCLAKSQKQLCARQADELATSGACPDKGEFCCSQLVEGADMAATSIKRTLALPSSGASGQDLVINDQHSSAGGKSRPQAATSPSTGSAPSSSQEAASGDSGTIGLVSNVLVDLLDSWMSSSSESQDSGSSTSSESQAHREPSDQNRRGSNDEPDAGRPSSPGLSFRQQQQQSSNELITEKCAGYCTMNLFTMLCDSTHRSSDCGPSQKCCITGVRDTNIGGESSAPSENSINRQPARPSEATKLDTNVCRGSCLPVYHGSLCTKPKEIYTAPASCLPNQICCADPEGYTIDGDSAGDETLEQAATAAEPQSAAMNGLTSAGELAKELFASLMPPLPPSLSIKDDQLTGGSRMRPQEGGHVESPGYPQPVSTAPKAKHPESSANGGFMSHIYQMFRPSGGKNRQSPASSAAPQASTPTLPVQLLDYYSRVPITQQQQQQLILSHGVLDTSQIPNAASFYPSISYVESVDPPAYPMKHQVASRSWQQYAPGDSPVHLKNQIQPLHHHQQQQVHRIAPTSQQLAAASSQPQVFHVSVPQQVQMQAQPTIYHNNIANNNNPRLVAPVDYQTVQAPQMATLSQQSHRYQPTMQQQQQYQQRNVAAPRQQQSQHQYQAGPTGHQQEPASSNRRRVADSGPSSGSSPGQSTARQIMTRPNGSHNSSSYHPNMDNALVSTSPISQSAQATHPRPKQQNQAQRPSSQQQHSVSTFAASDARIQTKEVGESRVEPAIVGQQHESGRPIQGSTNVNRLHKQQQGTSDSQTKTVSGSTIDPSGEPERQPVDRELSVVSRSQASSCGVPGGRRRSSGARIMGGSDAKPGHWCWQVALMNNKNEYLCGGALIGSRWVLTAAHCITQHVRSENQLYVRLGQHDLNSTETPENSSVMSILVRTSYVHHNHNGITLDNDIALLRLEEPADLGDPSSICQICLPERSSRVEPGKRCMVTGYGYKDEEGPAALKVRQVELPIVGDQECQKKTSAVLDKPFTLPASSFCAGGEPGQDACHGDGGSPLACLVDGYYELTGIVSWGYKCGQDSPGLYSKVSTFVGWINQIVSVNN